MPTLCLRGEVGGAPQGVPMAGPELGHGPATDSRRRRISTRDVPHSPPSIPCAPVMTSARVRLTPLLIDQARSTSSWRACKRACSSS